MFRRLLSRWSVAATMTILVSLWLAACAPVPAAPAAATSAPSTTIPSTTSAPPAATTAPTTAPSSPSAAQPAKGGTLRVAFLTTIEDTGDLHKSTSSHSAFLAGNVLDTLIRKNPADASYNPGLASSWELAPDNKSITLHLRQDVKFHDGTPFNAEAVKFNLDRIVTLPEAKGKRAYNFLGGTDFYDKTEVIDDYTVRVNFKKVFARALFTLSTNEVGGIHSPTAIQTYGEKYGTDYLVGTGPFKFVSWTGPNGDITFVRNEDYNWASPIYKHQGPAFLDGFTVKGSSEPSTRTSLLESGSVDVSFLQEKDINLFTNSPGFKTLILPKQGTTRGLGFNLKSPILKESRVRQAISHAIDREGLVKSPRYSGVGAPSLALLTQTTWGASTEEFRPDNYLYDLEKAKQLLEEVGWKDSDGDGVREAHAVAGVNDGTKLELNEVVLNEVTEDSEVLQGMFAKAGIKTNLQVLDFDAYVGLLQEGKFDLAMWSNSGSTYFLLTPLYHTGGGNNFWGYSNPDVDALLDKADVTVDADQQRDLFRQIQKTVMKEIPLAPVVDWMYPWAMKDGVQGLTTDAAGIGLYLYDAWLSPGP